MPYYYVTFAMLVMGKTFAANVAPERLRNTTLISHMSNQAAIVSVSTIAIDANPIFVLVSGSIF